MRKIGMAFLIVTFVTIAAARASDENRSESIIKNSILQYPLTYRSEPIGYRAEPPGYQAVPLGFREKPIGYREQPLNYTEKIAGDIGLPRGYSPNPPNFIEKANHPLADKDPTKQLGTDTLPMANNSSSLKISTNNHPNANKEIVQS